MKNLAWRVRAIAAFTHREEVQEPCCENNIAESATIVSGKKVDPRSCTDLIINLLHVRRSVHIMYLAEHP